VVVNQTYLVTRNARDKVQVVITELDQNGNSFIIRRTTGQYQGKMINQPELLIEKGKAKRSVIQQADLEYNSIINKYLDKGYKKLSSLTSKKFEELTSEEIDNLVPTIKSDSSGNLKPMLAKSYDKCQNSVLNKPMFCSRKLNGVRCMIKLDDDGNVTTVSRGGKNYNVSAQKIMKEVEPFLKAHPDYILDGELYRHGHYLQELSGIARLQEWEDRCEILEYWIYDIASDKIQFNERYDMLMDMQDEFKDLKKVKVIDHELTNSWDEIQRLHDKWVKEGYEGLVARKPDKVYEFGKRGSTMIKVKQYQDDEFTIIDYKDGLRDEDFCFICETKDGKPFAAKPIGDRELKAEYIKNIDDIIGKKGTVKFFEISKDGLPQQPIFQAVRYDEDIDK
jgi:ATP-dependent DNA ligase